MEYIGRILEFIKKIFVWWIVIVPWQQGVRIRGGKKVKVLGAGFHFRIPLYDQIYVQDVRLRVISMPPQTVSTRDNQCLTIVVVAGYSINDICKVYESLYRPESTLCHMVQGEIADYINKHDLSECIPSLIQQEVFNNINNKDYGITFEYVKITGYAVVRTYRLIQDHHWVPDGVDLEKFK